MNLNIHYNSKDLSRELEDYSGSGKGIVIESSKKLFVGFHKPIDDIYLEIVEKLETDAIIKVEVDTANGLKEVLLRDSTFGLSHSGRLSWKTNKSEQVKFNRNGKDLFWVSISFDKDIGERKFIGINTIFSEDSDLDEEYPNIAKFHPEGATSFIKFHMAARKDIVQILRKRYMVDAKLLDQFDLLKIEEVRSAAKYLTLAKIFFWLADTADDKWRIKSKEFYGIFSDFIDVVTLTIDKNDNGIVDSAEDNAIHTVLVMRE